VATFTLKTSSTALLISGFVALRATRNVKICPCLRLLSSSVEFSLRMTLFLVTTGDLKMSQVDNLLIVGCLLRRSFFLHSLFRSGSFLNRRGFSLRFSRTLGFRFFFYCDFCFPCLFAGIEKTV